MNKIKMLNIFFITVLLFRKSSKQIIFSKTSLPAKTVLEK